MGLILGAILTLATFGIPLLFQKSRPNESVPLDVRQLTEQRLLATPAYQSANTAIRIYDAVQEVVEKSIDANKNLEAKASGVIVLSSALLGFSAEIANAHRAQPAIAILAAIALVAAIVCAARVNFVWGFALPSPIAYNLPSIANLPENEAKIVVELSEAWNAYAVDERNAGIEKAAWLRRSFAAMVLGVVFFTLMSSVALMRDASMPASPTTTSTER